MRILKYIFRIDYPISYSLIDKFGEYLDFINKTTKMEPYSDVKNNIDIVSHQISSNGLIRKDRYLINLSLDSMNGEVEFENSTDFSDINKCPLFSLIESLTERLKFKNSDYKRIGLRIMTIETNDRFQFNKILSYTLSLNDLFVKSISEHTPKINDIALTLESINEERESVRFQIGPYQSKERKRYFRLDPKIEEGLLVDLDIWQNRIAIPEFKITEMIKQNIKIYTKVLPAISKNLFDELKK